MCDTVVSILDREERLSSDSPMRTFNIAHIDRAADEQRDIEAASARLKGKIAAEDYDVFLCHNSLDKAAVRQIGESLKEEGILPWLDEWNLVPGRPWQRALESEIPKIKSAAVFVGESGIGPWQHEEIEAFLDEFVRRRCPVIPVLLSNAPAQPVLPVFLKNRTWVDFRRYSPDPMKQLIWGVTSGLTVPR